MEMTPKQLAKRIKKGEKWQLADKTISNSVLSTSYDIIEIKQCPCCGNNDNGLISTSPKYALGQVTCINCGLTMMTDCGLGEAIIRWNKRA